MNRIRFLISSKQNTKRFRNVKDSRCMILFNQWQQLTWLKQSWILCPTCSTLTLESTLTSMLTTGLVSSCTTNTYLTSPLLASEGTSVTVWKPPAPGEDIIWSSSPIPWKISKIKSNLFKYKILLLSYRFMTRGFQKIFTCLEGRVTKKTDLDEPLLNERML